MTDFRNNLLTEMIHIYGFEHENVINFARLCEMNLNDTDWDAYLATIFIILQRVTATNFND